MVDLKLFVKTYGCQMNVYDSLRMSDLMLPMGYKETEEINEADMVILNTCHIREKAADKVYSELGRVKKIKDDRKKATGRDTIIAVAGCVSQAEGDEIFRRAPYVDIVVGPQSYHALPRLVKDVYEKKGHHIELDFIEEKKFDLLPEALNTQGVSAFVSVQEGCDKFCAFCVVPYTRGAEFSRPFEQVYRETLHLVSQGAKEIHLLGQNVNAYHGIAYDGSEKSLADLIIHLAAIKSVERIRYTTSHPLEMTDQLIALHGREPKLMPFLHLPVQSGSNNILKKMNRKHTREYYFEIIDKLREACPDIVLSSDFIVGFPGETDKDFEDTLDLVKRVRYGQTFSFKYSPRPGTPAALKEQVPEDVKQERLVILQKELMQQQFDLNKDCVGKRLPVLFDKGGKKDSNEYMGKTPYMQSVHVTGAKEDLHGKIVEVEIVAAHQTSLSGIVVSESKVEQKVA